MPDHRRRIALVTGASRGLGKATALALAAQGDHVILVARDAEKLRALAAVICAAGGSAAVLPGDLADAATAAAIARHVADAHGRLDALFLNAARLGPLLPLTEVTEAEWSQTLATNLTANWRLLRALHPCLQRSPAPRVLAVSSSAAANAKPDRGPYAISKLGLELLIETYALEAAGAKVCANLLDPGRLATDMRAAAVPGEDPTTLPAPQAVVPLVIELLSPACEDTGRLFRFADWSARRTSLEAMA